MEKRRPLEPRDTSHPAASFSRAGFFETLFSLLRVRHRGARGRNFRSENLGDCPALVRWILTARLAGERVMLRVVGQSCTWFVCVYQAAERQIVIFNNFSVLIINWEADSLRIKVGVWMILASLADLMYRPGSRPQYALLGTKTICFAVLILV